MYNNRDLHDKGITCGDNQIGRYPEGWYVRG
jgi:hypothetical protein